MSRSLRGAPSGREAPKSDPAAATDDLGD